MNRITLEQYRQRFEQNRGVSIHELLERYDRLHIHFQDRALIGQRLTETWIMTVRAGQEDLEAVVAQVRAFYESRIPFMERNVHQAPLGTIAITSSSQVEINIVTSYDPSYQQIMDRLMAVIQSGLDRIEVANLIFTYSSRLNPRGGMSGSNEMIYGARDTDGGPNEECFGRSLLFHLLKFDETRLILACTENRRKKTVVEICKRLNENRPHFIVSAFNELKSLVDISWSQTSITPETLKKVVAVFPTIQIVVFYDHNPEKVQFWERGAQFNDKARTLGLIYIQWQLHVRIIENWSKHFRKNTVELCHMCLQVFPKLRAAQAMVRERGQYMETHTCGECKTFIDPFHNCIAVKCTICCRPKSVCAEYAKEEPPCDEDADPLFCSECGQIGESNQCIAFHQLAGKKCNPKRFKCDKTAGCFFIGTRKSLTDHVCGEKMCDKCKVPRPDGHLCFYPRIRKIANVEEKKKLVFYAFDLEAVLKKTGESRRVPFSEKDPLSGEFVTVFCDMDVTLHEINCIIVQEILVDKKGKIDEEVFFILVYLTFLIGWYGTFAFSDL